MTAAASELPVLSALELSELIAAKKVSPVEIAEAVLERIYRFDGSVNAFVTVTDDLARKEAREAEARALAGTRLGPLDGIPYSIKDLIDTAGIRTTHGSKWHEHEVPSTDDSAASRLRSSGGVLLGKTNTPHFGHKDSCDNLLGPPTANPWNLGRTAGGSSGGAAAAIATGFGPVAHGTDGAGSIRIPASYCGVVGLKPSAGRIPYFPKADYWGRTATHGPIARTVSDVALLLDVLAGFDARDPLSIAEPSGGFLSRLNEPVPRLRVRWTDDFGYGYVEPEVAEICKRAVANFEAMGWAVEDGDPGWPDPSEFAWVLFRVVYALDVGNLADERPEWIEPTLMALVKEGRAYGPLDYARALTERSRFYEETVRAFGNFDILLSPTMPLTAPPFQTSDGNDALQDPWKSGVRRNYLVHPFNLTGLPAISIPCGWTEEGLSVGLQIAAGPNRDDLVLRTAAAYEEAFPWKHEWPELVQPPASTRATDEIVR
jgi:Asp-tRNA(Asn)/Glu-tRNA(Gln) amidotransferase A subunit family amidase